MQVVLLQERLLEARLHPLPEEKAVRQHNGAAAAGLQSFEGKCEEEVGGLAGAMYGHSGGGFNVSELLALIISIEVIVAAILGVLGVHELGHYVMSRYHDVDATLPYFIPFPSVIGSMGAVIRMKGRIPDRTALFDIGVAGPLAGLVATVVVTVIGLQLDPLPVQEAASGDAGTFIRFNNPVLLVLIAEATGTAGKLAANGSVHPVVFGGWVGMLVTVLNLLPVGQLDGGHILRAVVGPRQETLSAAVPGLLFALAAYLYVVRGTVNSVAIWVFWGLFALGLAYAGAADPIYDEPLDRRRVAVGLLTLGLGLLCFTPVPIEIVTV